MYDAIMKYGLFGEVIDLPRHLRSNFKLLKPNIDASINRHIASVENGKKGGAPKGNQNASKDRKQPKIQPENNHETDTAIDKTTDADNNLERENARGGGSKVNAFEVLFPPVVKDDHEAYKKATEEETEQMRNAALDILESYHGSL